MKHKTNIKTGQNIIIYKDSKGNVELKADVIKETVWANLDQIASLFGRDKSVISRHLKSIFSTKELDKKAVVAFFATTASDGKTYKVEYFNLDAILSVGYRVNSKQATQFRIWATKTLREYILKGVAINSDRIKQLHEAGIQDLKHKIAFIQNTILKRELDGPEVNSLLSVISDYANSWLLLKKYDEGELGTKKGNLHEKQAIDYTFARHAIDTLKTDLLGREQASDIFGRERDESFQGILRTIYQTYDGVELYKSLEEKAAHLLYFIIKDHPFSDGNKRIGSFMFIIFLERNGLLYGEFGERKIQENTLVALALLVAESDPKQKEIMVALITHLIV